MNTTTKQSPQGFITDWAFANDHKIFVNLDKELYWLEYVNGKESYWCFEHNSTSTVPNYDYDKIKQVMKANGYKYYAD